MFVQAFVGATRPVRLFQERGGTLPGIAKQKEPKMLDHHEGRLWADNHISFSNAFGTALEKVLLSFERLNARFYDAPWERVGKRPLH